MIDFDLMLVHVGEFGLYQKILFLFQAPFCIFVTFVLFGQLFIYIYPRHFWCQEHPCFLLNHTHTNLTRDQRRNISIPYNFRTQLYDPCNTYDMKASQLEALVQKAKDACARVPICNQNRSQICDYSVTRDKCTMREGNVPPRGKRQYYGRGPAVGGPQYIPGTGEGSSYGDRNNWYTSSTSRTPTTPGYDRRGGYYEPELPPTRRPPSTDYNDRDRGRGTPSPPVTLRPSPYSPSSSKNLDPTCDAIRVNRYSVINQTNQISNVRYNLTDSRNRTTATLEKGFERIMLSLPNNTFIDAEDLTNFTTDNKRRAEWGVARCHNWTYLPADLPYPTIVSELNWWCDAEDRIFFANAVFYLGAIIGGIGIGYIADMGGRVPALVTANLLGCLGGALSALFYTQFWLFCIFRFISGMAFDNSFTMIYILVLEYVGPTYRTLVANLSIAVFYTIGTLILPWLALWIGNWRWYMLAISLPMSLAVIGIFVVPESARWLLSKGRTKEATRILRSFAKVNGRDVPEKIFIEFERDANLLYEEISKEKDATLMEALRKPRILKNFIFLTLIWSMIALVYDGHSRNVLNLGENIFVSFTIASSTEFPADMLLVFTLDRFGRRWLAFGSLCMCGGLSLAAALVPAGMDVASLVMALLARFCVNVAFNIGLQYAAELLPTVIRAQGVNVIHIMGYVASIIAPLIASIGRTNPALSLILLGIIASTGGVLCLFLPETLGEELPNTLEDGEVFGKDQSFWNCPICSKPKPADEEYLEPTPVQLRNNMRASLRGEGFRSSIISSKRTTPIDTMMMNPMATETTRLKRGWTK